MPNLHVHADPWGIWLNANSDPLGLTWGNDSAFRASFQACCTGAAAAVVPALRLSISITWELVSYANPKALSRFTESGAIVVGPRDLCFKKSLGGDSDAFSSLRTSAPETVFLTLLCLRLIR